MSCSQAKQFDSLPHVAAPDQPEMRSSEPKTVVAFRPCDPYAHKVTRIAPPRFSHRVRDVEWSKYQHPLGAALHTLQPPATRRRIHASMGVT